MTNIPLSDAIAELRRELSAAMVAGVGEPLRFELGPVELELHVEISAKGSANAEAKWWVVGAGAEVSGERTRSHVVKLTLAPQVDGRPVKIAGASLRGAQDVSPGG